jgi:hypothetical protein
MLIGKLEGKRLPERSTSKWDDNIKIELKETGCNGVDWIQLAQDRVQ